MLRNDRLRVGHKHWNCTDLNEKLLKQIIKENVVLWQLKFNFKLYSLLQPSPWGRGWDVLSFEYQLYLVLICLLTKQCLRVGIPLEEKPLKFTIPGSARAQMTLKFFPWTKLLTPWNIMFNFLKTGTFLYNGSYRLQIAADGSSGLP